MLVIYKLALTCGGKSYLDVNLANPVNKTLISCKGLNPARGALL